MRWLAIAFLMAVAAPSWAARTKCSTGNISIKSMEAGFVDKCQTRSCPAFRGAAVLTNSCSEPVGVQLKIIGLDSKGTTIAVNDFWPASVINIPPGDYAFSLDTKLDYDPRLKRFRLEVISVENWGK